MLKHNKNIEKRSIDGVSRIWSTPVDQYYIRTIYRDIQPSLARMFPLHLNFVNEEHCFQKYYRHRENSEVFSLELVLNGSMYYVQNNKKYHVKAESLFLVHHGCNSEFSTGPEGHCHRLSCSFTGNNLIGLLHTTRLVEYDVIKLDNFETVKNIMRECFNELKDKNPGFRRRTSTLGYRLLLELEENLEMKNIPELLMKAVDLMEHHISQQLTIGELAKALNSSAATLNRGFQKYFNMSTMNYFISLKIETAKSLLMSTNMQIQEIALSTGYSNALYFSSEFKKRTGQSPREFRKNAV